VKITNWKPLAKGSLLGFFDVELPSGLIMRRCSLCHKDGKRWVNPPQAQWTRNDGTITYSKLVEFRDRPTEVRFHEQALRAFDETFGKASGF
jgi:hypothetical protein